MPCYQTDSLCYAIQKKHYLIFLVVHAWLWAHWVGLRSFFTCQSLSVNWTIRIDLIFGNFGFLFAQFILGSFIFVILANLLCLRRQKITITIELTMMMLLIMEWHTNVWQNGTHKIRFSFFVLRFSFLSFIKLRNEVIRIQKSAIIAHSLCCHAFFNGFASHV